MKPLYKIMLLAAALHIALPMKAVDTNMVPTASRPWTSTQMLLAAAVAGATVLGLWGLYSWFNKPSGVPEQFTIMNSQSYGNAGFETFLDRFQVAQTEVVVSQPIDIQHIRAAEKFHGVLFGFSKGRYSSGNDAYIVRMDNSSGFIELSCSNIPVLSAQIKSVLEGFGVRNVTQNAIEDFLTIKFNWKEW